MDFYRFFGAAIVMGVIAPLFWLGVNVLEGKLRRLLGKKVADRKARRASAQLREPGRIGE